ncbi:MAG: tetratricopeptide repeat protein [Alphaproteobacteria bacterium]|nr:tetratricopeptide repeat protein [Alphaproteobacteria bacterium]
MAERTEDDILFEEIDDELRQDRAHQLWQAYGRYLISVVLAIVLGVGGYQGWRHYDISSRQASGESFQAAMNLASGKKTEDAYKAFSDIATGGTGGYKVLARFNQARLLAQKGDAGGAAQTYRDISGDGGVDSLYRDMAVILGALVEINIADADLAAMQKRLAPLDADASPWRFSAREISAMIAHKNGDKAKAKTLFKALSDDAKTPQGIRARAQEMLSILGQ